MRRGNGDGSIFKLSGKRRNPYAVRVTVGWSSDGKQRYKYIGYYKSKTEAKNALNKYLADPSGVIVERATLKYVFDKMIETSKFSDNTIRQYTNAFNQLDILHNKTIDKIQLIELEEQIRGKKHSTQSAIKKSLHNSYRYAIKHDYAKRNLAEYLEIDDVKDEDKRPKTIFTGKEIKKLWADLGSRRNDDIIIVLLYTGLRISELLNLEISDVNLADSYLTIRKSKTEAGKRNVPIHKDIFKLILKRYDESNKYLFTQKNKRIGYANYLATYWTYRPHTVHETRHTFITTLKKCGVDELTVKRLVGHKDKDVTARYTHITQDELYEAINKLKY